VNRRAGVAIAAAVLLACSSHRARNRDAAPDGRGIYLRACAACHGEAAHGDGPAASALRTPPPDLTLLAQRAGGAFPRGDVIAVITGDRTLPAHGTREMPIWSARFGSGTGTAAAAFDARRRLELLADYLASIQR
jgi:mono/diheme cytochrome c family protein